MTDVNLTWESLGSRAQAAISAGALTLIGGAIAIIPGYFWIIGGIVVGIGVLGYLGKKAYDTYKISDEKSQMKKWLQTQLESDNLTAELREKYAEMLAKLIS